MAIKITRMAYLTITLIGVIVVIAGISVYGIVQRDTSQTPTKIFKGLNEAEEQIVQDNIKSKVQHQHQQRKEQEKMEDKKPSLVDNNHVEYNYQDDMPEYINVPPIAKESKGDKPDMETSAKHSKNEEIQAKFADKDQLQKKYAPKNVDWGSAKSINISSKDDLKKVLSELKKSGDPSSKAIMEIIEKHGAKGNVSVEIKTVD